MINNRATRLFDDAWSSADALRIRCSHVTGARILDAGAGTSASPHRGSLSGGLVLAKLCLADQACVSLSPRVPVADHESIGCDWDVVVRTDSPLVACLGSQYAGWPISAGDYFAMASGPMRLIRGREEMLLHLSLSEACDLAVGVLESEALPTAEVIEMIASECGVNCENLAIAVAPSTSIAGSVQVVARSVETAMHKLHALSFDVTKIVSAAGAAPLPPPAKTGKTVLGIGRTNDAILYGGRVTLWVDCTDEEIQSVIANVPSRSSKDYGRPFAEVFKDYGYDFYKVDPLLFSPAVVTMHNLQSGRTWQSGQVDLAVMRQSFLV